MRLTRSFYNTLKDVPKDARIPSHQLMFRTGMIQQLASGIYSYLPLALRSIRKIEQIIREELDSRGCEEVLMPAVLPAELWQESGRWDLYGDLLLRFKDRKGADYCMGPTHEEAITDMVRRTLRSWKQLPWNLYQIQDKFRDEFRPRFGLMRGREFIMKDAYSFDLDEAGAKSSYKTMYQAYTAIFRRCGLQFRAVDAATGEIGGDMSHEFQVLASTGEDLILSCDRCDYAANAEKAAAKSSEIPPLPGFGEGPENPAAVLMETVETPGAKTIEDVASLLEEDIGAFLKCLVYEVDDQVVLVLISGNRDVNESKLQTVFNAGTVRLASDTVIRQKTGAETGYIGPVGLEDRPVIIAADYSVNERSSWITGANLSGKHLKNVVPGRDFTVGTALDLQRVKVGDCCPRCDDGQMEEHRGIEVGQVFYLGTKYSESMDCRYLSESGESLPAHMGCYGIGVGRTLAAAIEQNHDENGICWPVPIAPYEVVLLPLQPDEPVVIEAAELAYRELTKSGVEVVIDDRSERAGFKFNDADLVGYPVQVVFGSRSVTKGKAELKYRKTGKKAEFPLNELVAHVTEWIEKQRKGY